MKQTMKWIMGSLLFTGLASFTTINEIPKSGKASLPPLKWTVDKSKSSFKFSVTRLLIEEVEGKFENFDGTMESTKPDFSDAKINFTIDVNSVNSEDDYRDKHIKGEDFFEVTKYPKMSFVSTSFKPTGGKNYKLLGNLTIHGKTVPTTFDVVYNGISTVAGKQKAVFSAKTTINRFDFDLKWNKLTETGGLVVSKEVEIMIDVEMNKL